MTAVTGELTVTAPDGVELSIALLGDGPPLVVVPGSLQTAAALRPVAEHLADRHTCWLLDRRGSGRSGDAPPGAGYSIDTEYADVAAVVAAAGPGTTVLGYSYGALCALGAAANGASPQRLVLFEPPLPVPGPLAGPAVAEFRRLLDAGASEDAVEFGGRALVGLPDDRIAALRATPAWAGMLASARQWLRELTAVDALHPDTFRAVATPTILLAGDRPGPLRPGVEHLAATLADARLVELAGHGHDIAATDPTALAVAVTDAVTST